jgi:DNA polymerase-3 subunit delta
VIEAGDLRRNAPLRVACEKSKAAAALPCYIDNERDLVRLVEDEMRAAKLAIAPDARAALVSLIGGDRQASRSEIRKLALYAQGKDRVVLDDVLAVVADASALGLDVIPDGPRRRRRNFPRRLPRAPRPERFCQPCCVM